MFQAICKADRLAILFASLLKLPCGSTQTNQLDKVAKIWQDYQVVPMVANI